MKEYQKQTFNLPELTGISQKQVEEHLKLYEGYVRFTNHIGTRIEALKKDPETYAYELGELKRRFGFEWNGMRNHEFYFGALEGGPAPLSEDTPLMQAIIERWGSYDAWKHEFINVAKIRGMGWAMLYYDPKIGKLEHFWIDEHHLGQPNGLATIVALDCWEHAYLLDYLPSERGKYIEAYLANVNWTTVAGWFDAVSK